MKSSNPKVAVITGSTSGIGMETAIELAKKGFQIVSINRNDKKSSELSKRLNKISSVEHVAYIADLSVMSQVKKASESVIRDFPVIDVLINNAGLINRKKIITEEGFEHMLAVNHLAPFLLTHLLLDNLKASDQGRIINVASEAHKMAHPDLNDLNHEKRSFNPMQVYGDTKLFNILFTKKLATILRDSSVTVNACHPGVIASGFGHNNGWLYDIVLTMMKPFLKNPLEGAQNSIYLATDPDLASTNGMYFKNNKPKKPAKKANNQLADQLYTQSKELLYRYFN